MAMKTDDKVSISITRVKSTKIGLKETESNKALTVIIISISIVKGFEMTSVCSKN